TAHHHGGRAVHRRDRQTPLPLGQACLHLLHRLPHRGHAAQARELNNRPAPQRDHPRTVLQRQPTGHTRRSDLTLRMAHHRRRHHTGRPPHLRQ
ncbi:hypothetical protein ADK82_10855, partial [Streptomyces sp. NRRL S-4]